MLLYQTSFSDVYDAYDDGVACNLKVYFNSQR